MSRLTRGLTATLLALPMLAAPAVGFRPVRRITGPGGSQPSSGHRSQARAGLE